MGPGACTGSEVLLMAVGLSGQLDLMLRYSTLEL